MKTSRYGRIIAVSTCVTVLWLAHGGSTHPNADERPVGDTFDGAFQLQFTSTGRTPLAVSNPVATLVTATSSLPIIVGSEPAELKDRLKAVHSLRGNLDRDEIAGLCLFLKTPPSPQEKNLPGLNQIKNDILNRLRNQDVPVAHLTDTMNEIQRDPAQDDVSRDYAIQHLVLWYEEADLASPDGRAKIRAILHEAAQANTSAAGTALLGLHRLSMDDTTLDKAKIDRLALALAQSSGTHTATRITAIQVCAERGLKEVLPVIEPLAQSPGCVPLQLSAIAALGRLGGSAQAEALRKVETNQNATVNAARQLALRQVERREQLISLNPSRT